MRVPGSLELAPVGTVVGQIRIWTRCGRPGPDTVQSWADLVGVGLVWELLRGLRERKKQRETEAEREREKRREKQRNRGMREKGSDETETHTERQ